MLAESTPAVQILMLVIGTLLTIIVTLAALNLRTLSKSLDGFKVTLLNLDTRVTSVESKLDSRVTTAEKSIKDCKIDCDRNNVSKEDWVRGEGYTRSELKEISSKLSNIDGKLSIAEQLPQICAQVAREAYKAAKGEPK